MSEFKVGFAKIANDAHHTFPLFIVPHIIVYQSCSIISNRKKRLS